MPTDRISLRGLALDTVIGVEPWEQRIRQRVRVDADIDLDLAPAASGDDLAATIDYGALAAQFAQVARTPRYLLEALAAALAEATLRDPRVLQVRITVHKPGAVVAADDVAVSITRPAPGRLR